MSMRSAANPVAPHAFPTSNLQPRPGQITTFEELQEKYDSRDADYKALQKEYKEVENTAMHNLEAIKQFVVYMLNESSELRKNIKELIKKCDEQNREYGGLYGNYTEWSNIFQAIRGAMTKIETQLNEKKEELHIGK